jgi:hypothetical protein
MNVIVRYRVKADRAAENAQLIKRVFAQLAEQRPRGIRYASYTLPDGVTFVHVASISADQNPLLALAAFGEFTKSIKDRCEEPPVTTELTEVGAYMG